MAFASDWMSRSFCASVPMVMRRQLGKRPSFQVSQMPHEVSKRSQAGSSFVSTSSFLKSFLEREGVPFGAKTKRGGIVLPEHLKNEILETPENRRAVLKAVTTARGTFDVRSGVLRVGVPPNSAAFFENLMGLEKLEAHKPVKSASKTEVRVGIPKRNLKSFFDQAKPESPYLITRTALALSGLPAPANPDECLSLARKHEAEIKRETPWIAAHVKRVLPHLWT